MLKRLLLSLALAPALSAYGPDGHDTVGMIAEKLLADTRALKEARALLAEGETLGKASNWADEAKAPASRLTPEMKAFVEAHTAHGTFHYCDVPMQQSAYRLGLPGTRANDIVQILECCIKVLQTPGDARDNPLGIDKRTALRLAAHLVGDLHQPLHVGCSYIGENDKFVDPTTGVTAQDDAGGNYLHIGSRDGANLHKYWDIDTVAAVRTQHFGDGDDAAEGDLPTALLKVHPPRPGWAVKGSVETWPVQWANDTLTLTSVVFKDITPRDRHLRPANKWSGEHFEWVIDLPESYPDTARDTVSLELTKAGYRLAAMLKALWPENGSAK